jgi:hypothetical protein
MGPTRQARPQNHGFNNASEQQDRPRAIQHQSSRSSPSPPPATTLRDHAAPAGLLRFGRYVALACRQQRRARYWKSAGKSRCRRRRALSNCRAAAPPSRQTRLRGGHPTRLRGASRATGSRVSCPVLLLAGKVIPKDRRSVDYGRDIRTSGSPAMCCRISWRWATWTRRTVAGDGRQPLARATSAAPPLREFGCSKNERALSPLRVRRRGRVRLHAGLSILVTLACALARPLSFTA